jgi:NADH-quinone oxidoreductase subunit H
MVQPYPVHRAANMILASTMITIFFLGGWYPRLELSLLYKIPGLISFVLSIVLLLLIFVWIRATIPRYRYEQLMRLGWKLFLPISVLWVVLISGVLLFTGNLPDLKL